VLHLEIDSWLYAIENGDDLSPRVRRLAMLLEELRDKYYHMYKKRYKHLKGSGIAPKLCKWRFEPPAVKRRRYE
jgi:hypothetical protein